MYNMENRRDFFKALGLFTAGVIGAKIASYTPKKKEEELQVAESVVVKDKDGNEYNMVVVPKKEKLKAPTSSSFDPNERMRINEHGFATMGSYKQPETILSIHHPKKPRKLNA